MKLKARTVGEKKASRNLNWFDLPILKSMVEVLAKDQFIDLPEEDSLGESSRNTVH